MACGVPDRVVPVGEGHCHISSTSPQKVLNDHPPPKKKIPVHAWFTQPLKHPGFQRLICLLFLFFLNSLLLAWVWSFVKEISADPVLSWEASEGHTRGLGASQMACIQLTVHS